MADAPAHHWHAHLYWAPGDDAWAERAFDALRAGLPEPRIAFGRRWPQPVGPHTWPSFQIAYADADAPAVLAALEAHREGRTVFIHPLLADELAAHTAHAQWLGAPQPLRLDRL